MAQVSNADIASAFEQIADLMEILGKDPFRVNSYRKVARVVGDCPADVGAMAQAGQATDLPGVGAGSAKKIVQFVTTGKIEVLDELLAKVPPKLPELLEVAGLGPKTIAKLWKQADVVDKDSLAQAIGDGRLLSIEGIGPKKVQQLRKALEFAAQAGGRLRLDEATEYAARLVAVVAAIDGAESPTAAGSLRRGRETVGDIDILCTTAGRGRAAKIIQAFVQTKQLEIDKVIGAGQTKASIVLAGGVQVDLRVVQGGSFGAALQYFTGSKAHNVRLREIAVNKGLKLNEYGLFEGDRQLAGRTEDEIYQALALTPVEPELREDHGEIDAAGQGRLPQLVAIDDIRGDLHMHTTASDGLESIETMVAACRARGYAYMAVADHSKSQVQANGLDAARLAKHHKAIAAAASGIRVYFSCEVDIFKDGSLDFDDDVLATLDMVIAAPHSALSQKRHDATARIIRAIENPLVKVIAHPSGRLINVRAGMELGIEEIAAAAAANDVALEINAYPLRLDLRDTHVHAVVEAGAKLIINTDAHTVGHLDYMHYGVLTARRGWAKAADVVNTYPAAKFEKWMQR
ncbi:MAG: DNA polymerase/3'-5' exonuclease PolX [Planctomycetes bacterium]|nr:DNA polymerase/3'-5' exonuclease PolX [Planctomycetota bacterium]